jgi:hypothetical protein
MANGISSGGVIEGSVEKLRDGRSSGGVGEVGVGVDTVISSARSFGSSLELGG